jgi:hypothetical protein
LNQNNQKQSDLYLNELYVIIPKTHDEKLGIFPKDQQVSNKHVVLWNNVKSIPTSLLDNNYKVLKVIISSDTIENTLTNLGGGVYALPHIPNNIHMEEVSPISYTND